MGCKASKISVSHVQVVDIIATANNHSTNEGEEDATYTRDDRDIRTDADVDADADADFHIGRLIYVDPLEGGPMLIPVSEFLICEEDFQHFHELQEELELYLYQDEDNNEQQEDCNIDFVVSSTGDSVLVITTPNSLCRSPITAPITINITTTTETKDNTLEKKDDEEEPHQQQQQQQQQRMTISSSQEYKIEQDTTTTTTTTITSTSRSPSTASSSTTTPTLPSNSDNPNNTEVSKNQHQQNKKNRTTIPLNWKLGKVVCRQ